jgi:ABC-type branched-subunit amino acid transport system permease subunit
MSGTEEAWWREKIRPFVLGLGTLLALLGWLTWQAGSARWDVLAFVTAFGAAFAYVRWAPMAGEDRRENLTFLVTVVGLFGLLGVLSGWEASYLVFIAITILIFALFSLGLNLEYGYTGIINFGHVAFMGIGAYTTVLLAQAWLPAADAWASSTGTGILLVAVSAFVMFVIAAVFGNIAGEAIATASGRDPEAQQRWTLAGGLVTGLVAAALVVLLVNVPLSVSMARAYVVLGATLIGTVLAAIAGVLLGLPTLRLREDYLAIVTIGFAEILRRFWLNEAWLTQGTKGIADIPLPFREVVAEWSWLTGLSGAIGAGSPYKVFLTLLVLAALVFVYVSYEILVRSPYGRVLKAIREDEDVAAALGKNVFGYKLQALALGSAVAALAGALLAWHRVYISPSTFQPLFTFYAWIIIVLGGLGNNKGTILGALFLYTFFEGTRFLEIESAFGFSSSEAAAFRVLLIGVLLVAFMMFKPEGILGKKEEMVLGD